MGTLSEEEENFLRITRLVHGEGLETVRDFFLSHIGGEQQLITIININNTKLQYLRNKNVLSGTQYKLLFPTSGSGIPNTQTFDITLLCLLVRNIVHPWKYKGVKVNWSKEPGPSDTHMLHDILRMKFIRNQLFHQSTSKLTNTEFSAFWTNIKTILINLGRNSSKIDEYKTEKLDRQQYLENIHQILREVQNERTTLKRINSIYNDVKIRMNKCVSWIAAFLCVCLAIFMFWAVSKNQQFDPNSVEDVLREELSYQYSSQFRHIQPFPWDDTYVLDMEQLFMKLTWEKGFPDKNYTSENNRKLDVDYSMIFQPVIEGFLPKRILLLGIAGIGKTTLMQNLAYKWGLDTQKELSLDKSKYLDIQTLWTYFRSLWNWPDIGNNKVLFILKLREIKANATICDSVYDQLADDMEMPKSALCSYLLNQKEKLVLLLDGYDEYNDNTSTEISNVIKNKFMKKALVVVSTRPGKGENLMSKKVVNYAYTLHGLSVDMGIDYINNYFMMLNEEQAGDILIKRLFKDKLIEKKLLHIPMFIHLFCVLWKETRIIPVTTSEVYINFINYAFQRKTGNKIDINNRTVSKELMLELGSIAFHKWKLSSFAEDLLLRISLFSNFNISETNSTKLTETGFLVVEREVESNILYKDKKKKASDHFVSRVHFIHRSFQEFFQAFFISHTNQTDKFLTYLLLFQMDKSTISVLEEDLVFLQRFLCGLVKTEHELGIIIETYISHYKKIEKFQNCNNKEKYKDNLAVCITEAARYISLEYVPARYLLFTDGFMKYSDYLGHSKYTLLLQSSLRQHRKYSSLLEEVQNDCVNDNYDIVEFVANCLHMLPTLKHIFIGENKWSKDFLSKVLSFRFILDKLELPIPWSTEKERVLQILHSLKNLNCLQTLHLDLNLNAMGKVLGEIFCKFGNSLTSLSLKNSNFRNADYIHLQKSFKCLKHVLHVELIDINFESVYFVKFGQTAGNPSTRINPIRHLKISGSTFTAKTTKEFMYSIAYSNLEVLYVDNTLFDMETFERHCILLKSIPSLIYLNIYGFSGESAKTIARSIKKMKNIVDLKLSWKNSFWNRLFNYDYMVDVTKELAEIDTIAYTDKNTKDIYLAGQQTLFRKPEEVEYGMRFLHLDVDYVSTQGLIGLSKLISTNNKLTSLFLYSEERIPQKGFKEFLARFKHLTSLKELLLSSLSQENTQNLKIGLKHLRKLKELAIIDSDFHADFFMYLNQLLPKLNSLNKLHFLLAKNLVFSKEGLGQTLIYLANRQTSKTCEASATLRLQSTLFSYESIKSLISTLDYVCQQLQKEHSNQFEVLKSRIRLEFDLVILKHIQSSVKHVECFEFSSVSSDDDHDISQINNMFVQD